MKFWLVKCRKYLSNGRQGWSWDTYFDDPYWSQVRNWGGADWIRSTWSKKIIREEVEKNDLIVCYQSEGRRICGFTRMAGGGLEASADANRLSLSGAKQAIQVEPELTTEQVLDTGCDPKWLRGGQGTIFPLSEDEFSGIVRSVRICCPGMEDKLNRWLKRMGVEAEVNGRSIPGFSVPKSRLGGAGFSTDRTNNAKVEQAAVRIVTQSFEAQGWTVEDVQSKCLGFDLICTKGTKKRLDVEVKGVSGLHESFPITYGEADQAKSNPNFVICVVTEALSPNPKLNRLTGSEFLSAFNLKPIQYMARRQ